MNVDVVVVTYRSARHLAPCLTSIPSGCHTIVVDNASSDESIDIARGFGATVIENEQNVGFAAAANQGASAGGAPYMLFLNPDAQLELGCLEKMIEEVKADPQVALVGPSLRTPDGGRQRPTWPFPSARRSWLEALGLLRLLGDRGDSFVVGACLLVRRAAFESVGGFDERYWLYGEEADLAYRLRRKGWQASVVEAAVATHVGGASGEGSDRAREEFHRGTERFIVIHDGLLSLLSHRVAVLFGSLLRILALSLIKKRDSDTAADRRRMVRRLVRVLLRHPLTVPMNAAASHRTLVVLSLEAWDEVWRRNQFLVRELLAMDSTLRVLFVEPPVDVPYQLVRSRSLPRFGRVRTSDYHPRLVLFTPTKWLPRSVGPWTDRSLLRQLRRAMRVNGFADATLSVNDPSYAGVTKWRGPLLYDLTDDWTEADRPRRQRDRLKKWDRILTSHADVVVACSRVLLESHASADARLIPNAVDVEHFTAPQTRPRDLPQSPVAVYVGTLHKDRLDVDLVVDLARQLPDLSVALVGPNALSDASGQRLRAVGVKLLGSRPYLEIPAYLQHADVVVVPHVLSPFTATLDPIKAYECLAVGKPTVATPVAGFVGLGPPVVLAEASSFVPAVAAALEHRPEAAPPVLPSWRDRAREFRRALDDALSTRSHRPPSIVYLDHCARLSGGELALARLLPSLDVRAHVLLGEDGPLVDRLVDAGVSVEVLPMATNARDLNRAAVRPGRLPLGSVVAAVRYTVRLSRRLRALHPDIVHTNSLKAAVYGSIAARLARVPVVVHVRDRIAEDYLPKPAVVGVRLLLRLLPNAVIANSHATLATLHLPESHTTVVPSPVIYDVAQMLGPPSPRLRDDVFTVVMVGRIAAWKGQEVFIRAFADAFPIGPERALVIGAPLFGEDDVEAELRQLVASLGLDGRVEFTGFRADVDTLLAEANVLVHASTVPEPFGQVVLEGMASGVAVIASDAGGPAEIIENGVSGLLVPPGDAEALAKAMMLLRHDELLRDRLAAGGRTRALDFRPSVIAPAVEALYEELIRS